MNDLLWGVFPYVALTLFFVVPVIRMVFRPYGLTTRASGIFNRGAIGIASLLLHWGIFLVFAGHIAGLVGGILAWGSWIQFFFWAGAIGGLMALVGSLIALIRRYTVPEVRAMSQPDDYLVHYFLIAILALALYQGLVDRIWGVAYTAAPWFASLWRFQPEPELMASAGLITQIHVFLGFVFAAYFPFTKLAHAWTLPINYFVRPYQSMRTKALKFERRWEMGLRSDKSFMTYAVLGLIAASLAIAFFVREPQLAGYEVAAMTQAPGVAQVRETRVLEGYPLYVSQCARCHGIAGDGDGDGKNSPTFGTLPRDLTTGAYRFVSTQSGIAADEDLRHVIVNGLPSSGMPGFADLSERQVQSLVAVLDFFWKDRPDPGPRWDVPPRTPADRASVARGAQAYADNCGFCHGAAGGGDGEMAADIEDFPGHNLRPADLAAGEIKAGRDPVQLYYRIAAGIPNGLDILMPGYGYLTPEEIWDLVNYLETEILPPERLAAAN